MAETTHISWADSTLNFWEGCQETGSPACVGCYARERNLRYAPKGSPVAPNWGPHAPRREVKSWPTTLRKISRDAKAAFAAGRTEPWFVFVNSLSDFFDNQADPDLRRRAFDAFRQHPHLTFLLLTKRPQNIVKMFAATIDKDQEHDDLSDYWPDNAALLCTVVTQAEADRDLPHLLIAAAALRPAFVGVSMEPLQEVVDIAWALSRNPVEAAAGILKRGRFSPGMERVKRIGWVITGGGTNQGKMSAAPTHPKAFRLIRDQCAEAGVAYHHKQNGEWTSEPPPHHNGLGVLMADGEFLQGKEVLERSDEPGEIMFRVGKKAAGRLLDGVTHDARPDILS